MEENQSIILACVCDDAFALPTAVMLYSALENLGRGVEVTIYLLDAGIQIANRERLEALLQRSRRSVTLHRIETPVDAFLDLGTNTALGYTVFLRMTLPERLPPDIGKVLYLDGDLVVVGNLCEAWQQDAGDLAIWAVRDYYMPYVSSPGSGLAALHAELGLPAMTPYFNSGVMLMNLAAWRAEDLSRKFFAFSRAYQKRLRVGNQDALNAVIAGNWGEFDLSWNVQIQALRCMGDWPASDFKTEMYQQRRELRSGPDILHFTGPAKPWKAGLINPYRSSWFRYLKASGWFTPEEYRRWYLGWFKCALQHATQIGLHRVQRMIGYQS